MQTLKQRVARIAPYFTGARAGFAVAIAGSLVGAATEPVLPWLMKPLLDKGFQAGGVPLWLVPLVIVGLFALRGASGWVAQYALSWSAHRGVFEMRRAMFERLLAAQPGVFSRHSASSLTNTVVYEVQSGATQLVGSLLSLVKDSFSLIALLGYLLWQNWQLTLFVAVILPSVAYVMRTVSKRLHRLTVAGQSATDELAYVVEENVLAWRIVRLHGAQDTEARRFGESSHGLRRLALKMVAANSTMTPLTQVLASCALSAVLVVALWQSSTSGGTVGSFASFITAMLMIISPIKSLSEVAGPITRGLAAIERGLALIEDSPLESGGSFDPGRSSGDLELRGVTLRYRDDMVPALDDVSLTLHAGEAVALVGPSGAGKSTLVNLLPRFIEPNSGSLWLDGHPLTEWNVRALRRQFTREPGRGAVQRHRRRERMPRRSTRPRARCRGASRREPCRLRRDAAPGHRLDGRPQRQRTLGRAATAPGDRPRDLQGRADPDPRRGDVGARLRVGTPGAGRARGADARPHLARDRAPAVDDRAGRPHRRARGRAYRRAGFARRPADPWRAVRPAAFTSIQELIMTTPKLVASPLRPPGGGADWLGAARRQSES
jgi:ABC-type transport system involved in cytochrome bd biosynthesis fused ATPase/permease subunit